MMNFKAIALFVVLIAAFTTINSPLMVSAKNKSSEIFSKEEESLIKKMAIEALLENPEVLLEVSRMLKEREEKKKSKNTSLLLKKYKKELIDNSDTEVLGNPKGDITIVEFFDYNCAYCKVAAQSIRSLIKSDGNIKFIPREWPILNSVSVFASKAAIASIKQKKYKEFHWKLMEKKSLSEDSIIGLADDLGIDLIQLEDDMNSEFVQAHLKKSASLARKIGFSGTPLFIIEDKFIPGFVPVDEMKKIISEIRKNK